MGKQSIRRAIDADGDPVVHVALARPRGLFAVLDEADYGQWAAEGLPVAWYLSGNGHSNFARLLFTDGNVAGKKSTVARRLLRLGRGQCVGYNDRNPLNLCRKNLRVSKGFAKGQRPIDGVSLSEERVFSAKRDDVAASAGAA